jgi:hypothetical protein
MVIFETWGISLTQGKRHHEKGTLKNRKITLSLNHQPIPVAVHSKA